MGNLTPIIRIRKGINGHPYAICTQNGYFIADADSIKEIKERYKVDLKVQLVRLVQELDFFPEDYKPDYTIYGYARVSTKGQARDGNSLEAQEEELKAAGADIIIKEAYTGIMKERPEFDKLINRLKKGDTLIVTKLDRIARTVEGGTQIIKDLIEKQVKVNILNLGIIDNTPAGKLTYQMFLAFAEFERDMIVLRTQEGKAIARTKDGYREGRPRTDQARLDHAMELLKRHSYKKTSEMTGISVSTLSREKRRRT